MICLLIIIGIFLTDYIIKNNAEAGLKEKREILQGKIILNKCHNTGAAFSLGEKNPSLVLVSSLLCVIVVTIYLIRRYIVKGMGPLDIGIYEVGVSMFLGGALSNLYDRISKRYVVDYFSFNVRWPKLRNIVFNISDMFIFLGVLVGLVDDILKG